jgi:hypothetical protein
MAGFHAPDQCGGSAWPVQGGQRALLVCMRLTPLVTIPSLLGRDILSRFALFMEERTNRPFLLEPDAAFHAAWRQRCSHSYQYSPPTVPGRKRPHTKCKLGYQCIFHLMLWVLYPGMQWRCLPVPKDINGNPAIHSRGLGKHNHPHDSEGRSYDPRGAGRVPKSISRTLSRPRTRTSSCMVQ